MLKRDWRLFKCGSNDHLIRDYLERWEGSQAPIATPNQVRVGAHDWAKGRGGEIREVGQWTLTYTIATQDELGGLRQVYVVRELHEQCATDVIKGAFTLRTIPLFFVIDSRSTYSYVSSKLASELGIPVETIDKCVTVTSSFGDIVCH